MAIANQRKQRLGPRICRGKPGYMDLCSASRIHVARQREERHLAWNTIDNPVSRGLRPYCICRVGRWQGFAHSGAGFGQINPLDIIIGCGRLAGTQRKHGAHGYQTHRHILNLPASWRA